MTSNSQFAVAIHVLSVLGTLQEKNRKRVSSQQIAVSVNTNAVLIRNLVGLLKNAGLVLSKEGKGGGLSLARTPNKISLLEIYSAVHGDQGVLRLSDRPEFKSCPISRGMKKVLPHIFKEVDRAVEKTLKGRTLKNVMDQITIEDAQ